MSACICKICKREGKCTHMRHCLEHCIGIFAGCMRRAIHISTQCPRLACGNKKAGHDLLLPPARVDLASLRPASTGVPAGPQHSSHCSMCPNRQLFSSESGFQAIHPISYTGLDRRQQLHMPVRATGAQQQVGANWQHITRAHACVTMLHNVGTNAARACLQGHHRAIAAASGFPGRRTAARLRSVARSQFYRGSTRVCSVCPRPPARWPLTRACPPHPAHVHSLRCAGMLKKEAWKNPAHSAMHEPVTPNAFEHACQCVRFAHAHL